MSFRDHLGQFVHNYTQTLTGYDRQQWQVVAEKRALLKLDEMTNKEPVFELKSNFIDLDLVRGSSFPKAAKSQRSWLGVVYAATLRVIFFPFYIRFWYGELNVALLVLLAILYSMHLIAIGFTVQLVRAGSAVSVSSSSSPANSSSIVNTKTPVANDLIWPIGAALILASIHLKIVTIRESHHHRDPSNNAYCDLKTSRHNTASALSSKKSSDNDSGVSNIGTEDVGPSNGHRLQSGSMSATNVAIASRPPRGFDCPSFDVPLLEKIAKASPGAGVTDRPSIERRQSTTTVSGLGKTSKKSPAAFHRSMSLVTSPAGIHSARSRSFEDNVLLTDLPDQPSSKQPGVTINLPTASRCCCTVEHGRLGSVETSVVAPVQVFGADCYSSAKSTPVQARNRSFSCIAGKLTFDESDLSEDEPIPLAVRQLSSKSPRRGQHETVAKLSESNMETDFRLGSDSSSSDGSLATSREQSPHPAGAPPHPPDRLRSRIQPMSRRPKKSTNLTVHRKNNARGTTAANKHSSKSMLRRSNGSEADAESDRDEPANSMSADMTSTSGGAGGSAGGKSLLTSATTTACHQSMGSNASSSSSPNSSPSPCANEGFYHSTATAGGVGEAGCGPTCRLVNANGNACMLESTLPAAAAYSTLSCLIWDESSGHYGKVNLSVYDIGMAIKRRVEQCTDQSSTSTLLAVVMSLLFAFVPLAFSLAQYLAGKGHTFGSVSDCLLLAVAGLVGLDGVGEATTSSSSSASSSISSVVSPVGSLWTDLWLFAAESNGRNLFLGFNTIVQRLALSWLGFLLLFVAEHAFRLRLLSAKHFCYLTSLRRAKKYGLPHFRLNKVVNIKSWLMLRSYVKRLGPQHSVDAVVSTAFVMTVGVVCAVCVEVLQEGRDFLSQSTDWELLLWFTILATFLLRFLTLGIKINQKYRNPSVLITEQINLYLKMENKPHKKEELMTANQVLKLAEDLLKELECPSKILGLSANPILYNITKLIVLSAFSAVLTELLGFKLKLYKLKFF